MFGRGERSTIGRPSIGQDLFVIFAKEVKDEATRTFTIPFFA